MPNSFYSPNERRLRAGWRLLVHALLFAINALILGGAIGILLLVLGKYELLVNQLLYEGIFLICIPIATYLARRFVDRRSFSSLGLVLDRKTGMDLLMGILIPAVIMGGIFLFEWAFGWLHFEGFLWETQPVSTVWATVSIMFFVFILVGWNEELLTRGYWLQNIADGIDLPFGVVISSILFALLHLGNPNVTWVAVVGLVLAGLFLAYGYIRTRQLWLPIGLHIGWNFFENTVFGFPVSGLDTPGLLLHTNTGPELITGGAFGPEAGLIVIPGMIIGVVLIYWYTRGRVVPSM